MQNFGSRTWGTVTKILHPSNEVGEVMWCVLAVWGYVVIVNQEFRNLHKRLCQGLGCVPNFFRLDRIQED